MYILYLYTGYWVPFTVHWLMNNISFILHVYCTLCSQDCLLYAVFSTLFTVGCVLNTVYCTLCSQHCLLYAVFSTLFTVRCVLNTVYCAVFSTLFTVRCVLNTVYCTLCSQLVPWNQELVSGNLKLVPGNQRLSLQEYFPAIEFEGTCLPEKLCDWRMSGQWLKF